MVRCRNIQQQDKFPLFRVQLDPDVIKTEISLPEIKDGSGTGNKAYLAVEKNNQYLE
jgi:hypothetical protein